MNTINEYVHTAEKEKEAWLGQIVLYTISGLLIPHDEVIAALRNEPLLAGIIAPNVPKDVDVFRRIASTAGRSKIPTSNENVLCNYLVRQVDERDPDVIRRTIVREEVNKAGKKLSYAEVYFIEFKRTDSSILYAPLGDYDQTAALICYDIQQRFLAEKGCLNDYPVREMVRRMLLSFGAVKLRDAAYFVSAEYTPQIEALEQFVAALKQPDTKAVIDTVPLIDNRKQRDMIQRAFEAETSDSIDALLGEIQDLKSEGKMITAARAAGYITTFQELTKRTRAYADMLDASLGAIDTRLGLLNSTVMNIHDLVK